MIRTLSLPIVMVTALVATAAAQNAAAPGASAPPVASAPSAKAPNSAELAAFKKAIRAKYDMKERAFAEHDAETIVSKFYSEDEISVAAWDRVYRGRNDIRPEYQKDVYKGKVKIESVDTFVSGNAGWDWADFHVYPTNPKEKPFTFAILFLWAKENGAWICKGDYFQFGSMRTGKLYPPPPEEAKKP